LLKTRIDGLAAEVTQLKADQAKAQELHDKLQAEAELKKESLRHRLQTAIDSLRSKPILRMYCHMPEYSLFADHVFCSPAVATELGAGKTTTECVGLGASIEAAERVYQDVRSLLAKMHSTLERVRDVSTP
jgi:hypothetical protein